MATQSSISSSVKAILEPPNFLSVVFEQHNIDELNCAGVFVSTAVDKSFEIYFDISDSVFRILYTGKTPIIHSNIPSIYLYYYFNGESKIYEVATISDVLLNNNNFINFLNFYTLDVKNVPDKYYYGDEGFISFFYQTLFLKHQGVQTIKSEINLDYNYTNNRNVKISKKITVRNFK